jgi:hypothetical protein
MWGLVNLRWIFPEQKLVWKGLKYQWWVNVHRSQEVDGRRRHCHSSHVLVRWTGENCIISNFLH